MTLADFIHFLHLLAGIVWLGGSVVLAFVAFPALASLPADRAAGHFMELARRAAPLMSMAGILVLVTGGLRAWLGGGIMAWSDLFRPYGLLVVAAFLVVFVSAGLGGQERKQLTDALEGDAQDFAERVARVARRAQLNIALTTLAIAGLMTTLGLGLY